MILESMHASHKFCNLVWITSYPSYFCEETDSDQRGRGRRVAGEKMGKGQVKEHP